MKADHVLAPETGPYQVVEDTSRACKKCGHRTMFDVVFMPTETALGTTYGCAEEADEMADELNEAYSKGMNAAYVALGMKGSNA